MVTKKPTAEYSAADQMIVCGARQIKNSDVVYTGVGLPLMAALLAKHMHAPDCTIIIENGIIRTALFPLPGATDTLGSQTRADQLTSMFYINCLGQAGFINMGFIGAGQVDRYGNVNDTAVGDYRNPVHRWQGSGGANDVMSFCGRTNIVIRQSKRRFPERVDFLTCPGYLDGKPGRREEIGLHPNTGPHSVITDLGCYEFENGEMILKSVHRGCGITVEKVKQETGWDLKVSPDLKDSIPPTQEELAVLREKVDPGDKHNAGRKPQVED
jgi:glutaconate CoA-transferase, subunit B